MKKLIIISFLLFLSIATSLIAEETSADKVTNETDQASSLKEVDKKIDKIYDTQQVMYNEAKNNPLEDKTYGVEINLFRLLLMDEYLSFSGGFSLFDVDRNAEIAFPFFYQESDKPFGTNITTLDCHYRYFLGNTQNGYYLGAFTRLAHFSGYRDKLDSDGGHTGLYKSHSITDVGVGVSIGRRYFSYKGLYWGSSISFGTYLFGNDKDSFTEDAQDLPFDFKNKFISFEFLKFGWAF